MTPNQTPAARPRFVACLYLALIAAGVLSLLIVAIWFD